MGRYGERIRILDAIGSVLLATGEARRTLTIVGCTGHQTMTVATQSAIRDAILTQLLHFNVGNLEGVCSLAVGADQIFARAMLSTGGQLHVVIPCTDYATTFTTEETRTSYHELLASATSREFLPFQSPTEEAFMAAGRVVADRSDLLLAVWDGAPAAGLGGTADVVQYAKMRGKPVEVIWPDGARRS